MIKATQSQIFVAAVKCLSILDKEKEVFFSSQYTTLSELTIHLCHSTIEARYIQAMHLVPDTNFDPFLHVFSK